MVPGYAFVWCVCGLPSSQQAFEVSWPRENVLTIGRLAGTSSRQSCVRRTAFVIVLPTHDRGRPAACIITNPACATTQAEGMCMHACICRPCVLLRPLRARGCVGILQADPAWTRAPLRCEPKECKFDPAGRSVCEPGNCTNQAVPEATATQCSTRMCMQDLHSPRGACKEADPDGAHCAAQASLH